MTIDRFIEELKKINIELTEEQLDKFKKYASFLFRISGSLPSSLRDAFIPAINP